MEWSRRGWGAGYDFADGRKEGEAQFTWLALSFLSLTPFPPLPPPKPLFHTFLSLLLFLLLLLSNTFVQLSSHLFCDNPPPSPPYFHVLPDC